MKTITLTNDQTFPVTASQVSKDRYCDGVDWFYFETKSHSIPQVEEASEYHTWNLKNGEKLTGWLVPLSAVQTQ